MVVVDESGGDEQMMDAAESPERRDRSDLLEPSARALSEYIVRIALLPITLLMIKPREIARVIEAGSYKPLPPPFLLTFITGIAASGVLSNIGLLFTTVEMLAEGEEIVTGPEAFVSAVIASFQEADGVKAIIFAIPYIAAMWIFSGIVSFFMGRGFRNVEPLFAFLAFAIAAITGIGILMMVTMHLFSGSGDDGLAYVGLGTIVLLFFMVVILIKMFRYMMLIRSGSAWSWIGLALGFLVASVILLFVALIAFVPASMMIDSMFAIEQAAAAPS